MTDTPRPASSLPPVAVQSAVPIEAQMAADFSAFAARTFAAWPSVAEYVASNMSARLSPRTGTVVTREALMARLDERLSAQTDASGGADSGDATVALGAALRLLRADVFCLAMARDLAGSASVAEVTGTMSDLAEIAIGRALAVIEAHERTRHGTPRAEDGTPLTLGVVGMGKLGGRELNVSSDIDLIFVYEQDGETEGGSRGGLSHQEFFTRVARKLMAVISERTAQGYVFRVDTRLRPNGDAGPLVCSLPMLEEYFYVQGREWERYAWIKSRLLPPVLPWQEASVAAFQRLGDQLDALVRPFVYRRYLDFGAIEAIRGLHEQIGQEARRRASLRPDRADDIKLGRGGIREIEFSAQVFQLIRGGQDPTFRIRPTLAVLALAVQRAQLAPDTGVGLSLAYDFLRRLEHRLQYADDAQTHSVPVDPVARHKLAHAMGCRDFEALQEALNHHRSLVEREFDAIFDKPAAVAPGWLDALNAEPAALDHTSRNARRDADRDALAQAEAWREANAAWSQQAGYPEDLSARLRSVQQSLRYIQLPPASRVRFDALVALAVHFPEKTLPALNRRLDFLERIAGRSAYLSLLTEFPAALRRVFDVLGNSKWAADYLIAHPQLLDELLDSDALEAPFDWGAFAKALRARLARSDDVEHRMDELRRSQHAEMFRILLQDLAGHAGVEKIGDRLSELADTMLALTLEAVWRVIAADFRRAAPDFDFEKPPRFAIIAYGKLGGKELGYGSDLDVIFLYRDVHPMAAECFTRLARRLVTWLTTATGAGQLYDIDLRLRPNGTSGLLVTPIEAFRAYQLGVGGANTAWVWEHQALTRARYCAGDADIGAEFEQVRVAVLTARREPLPLAAEILSMRARAHEGHPNRSGGFDVKHDAGGMVDIEFIVQYMILRHAADHPELTRNVGNIALLQTLADTGLVTPEEAVSVSAAYRRFRAAQHHAGLDGLAHARVAAADLGPERAAVTALWNRIFDLKRGAAA